MILAAIARSEKEKDKRTKNQERRKRKTITGLKERFLNIIKKKVSLLQGESLYSNHVH